MKCSILTLSLLAIVISTSHAQNFWTPTEGPQAAGYSAMATNSKGWLYVGTDNSGIFLSRDWGKTWERKGNDLPNQGYDRPMRDICITERDDIYMVYFTYGVFKSTDNGATFQSINAGLPNPTGVVSVHAKALPNGKTQVFVAADGVTAKSFISDDDGATWTEIPLPGVPKTAVYETFISPNSEKLIVSIGYNKGLFRSSNRGQQWYRIDASPSSGDPGGNEADDNYKTIRANRQGHIFVGRNANATSTRFKNACVIRSIDDGESYQYLTNGWDTLDADIRANNVVNGIVFGFNNDVYATTQKNGTYFSSNSGDDWVRLTTGLPDSNGACIALAATPTNHIFAAPFGFNYVYAHLDPTMSVENLPAIIRPVVSAAPNPANDVVAIDFELSVSGVVRAEILSAEGISLGQNYLSEFPAGPQSVSFNTTTLAPGMYVWRLTAPGTSRTGQFIVVR